VNAAEIKPEIGLNIKKKLFADRDGVSRRLRFSADAVAAPFT
jgi:hypothetical protein